MKKFLVGVASKGNEEWTRNCEVVKADDRGQTQKTMEERLSKNGGYCFGVKDWYVTYVEELEMVPA